MKAIKEFRIDYHNLIMPSETMKVFLKLYLKERGFDLNNEIIFQDDFINRQYVYKQK